MARNIAIKRQLNDKQLSMATASVPQNLVVHDENSIFGTRSLRIRTVASRAVKLPFQKKCLPSADSNIDYPAGSRCDKLSVGDG